MRLGLILPFVQPDGRPPSGSHFSDSARLIEQVGFDSLWCFDAIGRGSLLPDPLIALSVAAAVTERIEVGTCILQVSLRQPVELAHRILTAHAVCQGRLLLGVGAGSTQTDFDAIGLNYATRMRDFEAALPIMRGLWRGEQVGPANLTPWASVMGGPPLLIGSWGGQRWIPHAAQEFDGWIASGAKTSYNTLAEGVKRYRDAGGKRAIVTNIAVDLQAGDAPLDDDAPFHLRCSPEAASERLQRLVALGFDDAILVHGTADEAEMQAMRALLPR